MGQHRASAPSRIDRGRSSCLKIDQGSCSSVNLHRCFVQEGLRRSPTSQGCKIIRPITSQSANRCRSNTPPRDRSCHKLRMAEFLIFTAATMSTRHQPTSTVLVLIIPILASISRFKETASSAKAGEKSIEASFHRWNLGPQKNLRVTSCGLVSIQF